eukprot:TCONS_00051405-protein
MTSRQLSVHNQNGSRRSPDQSDSSTISHSSPGHRTHAPRSTTSQRRTTSKPLNFQQAMSDFRTMFPELDTDVIETVLRANNGVVQTTIDQLLQLQESTQVEKAQSGPVLPSYESSIGDGEEPPPAYNDIWEDIGPPEPDPLFPNPKVNAKIQSQQTIAVEKPKKFPRNALWNAPLVGKLPNDFLRIDNIVSTNNSNALTADSREQSNYMNLNNKDCKPKHNEKDFMTDDDLERFMEDEKLAIFLQNEEFLRELRRNREFVSSLEADHQEAMMASGSAATPPAASVGSGGARPRTTPTQEDAQFRQKLRHMGKSTRKKFGKMAKKFSRNKSSGKPAPLSMTSSESTFNLLGDDEDEEPPRTTDLFAIDEDDDDDMLNPGGFGANVPGDQREQDNPDSTPFNKYAVQNENKRARPRPSVKGGRQLPKPPGTATSTTTTTTNNGVADEPIVFYSEDNEFAFKNE